MDRYVDKHGQICGVVMDCGVLTCSVISWWSVLLVEETGVCRENH